MKLLITERTYWRDQRRLWGEKKNKTWNNKCLDVIQCV